MFDRFKVTEHAMVTRMHQMEVITNNLANVDTTGFKRDSLFMNELENKLKEPRFTKFAINTHIPVSGTSVDTTQGALAGTAAPLDVAISGAGFFTVETPGGEALTRDGRFTVNQDNLLVTLDGFAVLGEGGPIEIDLEQTQPQQLVINDTGEIVLDGNVIDRLQIQTVDTPQALYKIGANLFQVDETVGTLIPAETVSLRQGFLEESNVDPIQELVSMMEVFHFYETGQRMVREQDRLLGRAVSDIGRLG